MAQIDSNLTKDQVAQMEREFARKRAAAERRRAAELARLSDERAMVDENQTSWTYFIVDRSFVRLIACDTAEETLDVPADFEGLLSRKSIQKRSRTSSQQGKSRFLTQSRPLAPTHSADARIWNGSLCPRARPRSHRAGFRNARTSENSHSPNHSKPSQTKCWPTKL